jgi:hypothetical protein
LSDAVQRESAIPALMKVHIPFVAPVLAARHETQLPLPTNNHADGRFRGRVIANAAIFFGRPDRVPRRDQYDDAPTRQTL